MKRRLSVRVRPLSGRCYTLQLLPWATVGEVRRAVAKKYRLAAASFDLKHGAGGATWCTNDAEMLEELEGDPGHPGPGATSELCVQTRPRPPPPRPRAPPTPVTAGAQARGRAPRLLRACAIL